MHVLFYDFCTAKERTLCRYSAARRIPIAQHVQCSLVVNMHRIMVDAELSKCIPIVVSCCLQGGHQIALYCLGLSFETVIWHSVHSLPLSTLWCVSSSTTISTLIFQESIASIQYECHVKIRLLHSKSGKGKCNCLWSGSVTLATPLSDFWLASKNCGEKHCQRLLVEPCMDLSANDSHISKSKKDIV